MLPQHKSPVFERILHSKKPFNSITARINRVKPPRQTAKPSEFIPVQLSVAESKLTNETTSDQKIEISLPGGIRVILSGTGSLSAVKSILNIL